MVPRFKDRLKASACRFRQDRSGQAAMVFAVSIIPVLTGAGVAIDFARVASKHTSL